MRLLWWLENLFTGMDCDHNFQEIERLNYEGGKTVITFMCTKCGKYKQIVSGYWV